MSRQEDLILNLSMEDRAALRALSRVGNESKRTGRKAKSAFSVANIAIGNFIASIASRVLRSAFRAVNREISELVTNARELSSGFGEVNTLMDESTRLTMAQRQAILNLNREFGGQASDQIRAFYDIVSSGAEGFSNQLDILRQSNIAAAAGISEVNVAADALTSILNTFVDIGADEAADALFGAIREGKTTFDELAPSIGRVIPLAQAAGVSFQETAGSLAFFTRAGVSTEESVTGLRAILSGIIKPTNDASKAAKELGIDFNVAALQSQGLAEFMRGVSEATGGNVEQISRLFPNVRALVPVLRTLTGDFEMFEEILERIEGDIGATGNAFEQIAQTFDFQAQRIVGQLDFIKDTATNALLPAITNVANEINAELDKITVDQIIDGLIATIKTLEIFIDASIRIFSIFEALVKGVQVSIAMSVQIIAELAEDAVRVARMFGLASQDTIESVERFARASARATQELADETNEALGRAFNSVSNFDMRPLVDEIERTRGRVNEEMNELNKSLSVVPGGVSVDGETEADGVSFIPKESILSTMEDMNWLSRIILSTVDETKIETEQQLNELAESITSFSNQVSRAMMNGIGRGAGQAFAAFGQAIVEGQNPLKEFLGEFLRMMGQMAVQVGTMFIMQGIASTLAGIGNGPALIAAGATLAAFGGVMGAVFGGGGAGGAASGVGSAAEENFQTDVPDSPIFDEPEDTVTPQEINVNVEGNVVDQDQFFNDMATGLRDAIQKDGVRIDVS